MEHKKMWISNLILVVLIIFVFAFGVYYLYLNIPGEAKRLEPVIHDAPTIQNQTNFLEVSQFYPNMKFNHNVISYEIEFACSGEKRQRMISAFDDLSSKVGLISFKEVLGEADIEISCSEDQKESIDKEHFIAGEGGAKEIVQTGLYNVISDGIVILHDGQQGFVECDWHNVELHELVHVFGFGHSDNSKSLMYSYLEDCDQKLDDSIIDELKRLYFEKNLAELYFDEVRVTKKGRYLNFNLTIKNSGSIDSEKTQFSVLSDGGLIESFDLEKISYGAGISIEIRNLKLNSRNPDEIRFVIDRDDLVDEIYEENNVVVVSLV